MNFFHERNKLPPPSTPRATGHNPEATTAADPLEEPPAILLRSYGFLVALQYSRLQINMLTTVERSQN